MRADIPVQPDSQTAREWAVQELSKDRYQQHGPSILSRILDWVSRLFSHLFNFHVGSGPVGAIIVIAVLAVGLFFIVKLTIGPVRRGLRGRREHSVFEDDLRTASQMRAAAKAAAERGDWNLAVLERFRAIVRSLEERDLIDDLPGVTAHEAATQAGARFPDVAQRAAEGADLFDGVRYGHTQATRDDAEKLRRLESALEGRSLLTAAPQ